MSEWTKEVPTKNGWYWWRGDPEVKPIIRQICNRFSWHTAGEWWPERIESPV